MVPVSATTGVEPICCKNPVSAVGPYVVSAAGNAKVEVFAVIVVVVPIVTACSAVMTTPLSQVAVFNPHNWNDAPMPAAFSGNDAFAALVGMSTVLIVSVSTPSATCTAVMLAAAMPMNC